MNKQPASKSFKRSMNIVRTGYCSMIGALALTTTIASAGPACPNANAGGPYTVLHGSPIQLDASQSFDINNLPLTYSWDTNGDGIFGDALGVKPTVTYAIPGAYGIAVMVTNFPPAGSGVPNCSIEAFTTVNVGNRAPIANAGGPYVGLVNVAVLLDGTNSSDPDGDGLRYSWDLTGNGLFNDSVLARPGVTFTAPGEYTVDLRVTDDFGLTSVRATTVTVTGTIPEPSTLSLVLPLLVLGGFVKERRARRMRFGAKRGPN